MSNRTTNHPRSGRPDANAVIAWNRNGGPMAHRNKPRGGSRNTQADLLADAEDDEVEGFWY